jgi:hypothetical protein
VNAGLSAGRFPPYLQNSEHAGLPIRGQEEGGAGQQTAGQKATAGGGGGSERERGSEKREG